MSDESTNTEPVDPKEAMRQALERKKAGHGSAGSSVDNDKIHGGPHGKAGAKRTFRRKSGG